MMSDLSAAPENITLYWMPGCSSCLRMKEFVEKTGFDYEAVNVDAEPERASFLRDYNIRIPAICVGEECVNGVHLETVAKLLDVEHNPPRMLSPAELRDRYARVIAALKRYTLQSTPQAGVLKLPDRDRDLLQVAGHAGCTMRYFLGKYDDESFPGFFDDMEPGYRDPQQLVDYIKETYRRFEMWWEEEGQHDTLDAVVQVYWGSHTLHEALEREVWHTAQHTRQVMYMLEQSGIAPEGPLTADDLDGLPLPERIYD